VDRLGVGDLGRRYDGPDVQIGLAGARRTDADVLVGEPDVERVDVRLRVDGDRADPQLTAGPDDAQGDLAAVGDQDLLEHLRGNRHSGGIRKA